MQENCHSLGCLSELDGKTLLLKTPHNLITEHGEIKSVLTRKLLAGYLAFVVPEGIMLVGENKKPSTVLPSC